MWDVEVVQSDQMGMRLDRWVHHRWPWIPYSSIHKSIRQGEVRINDRKESGTTRLNLSDRVSVRTGWIKRFAPPSEGQPLSTIWTHRIQQWIVFEDDHIVAFNKPAGIASQGGSGQWTSMDALIKQWKPQSPYRLVHRLDVGTSGILMFAKTLHCAQQLSRLFHDHCIRKTYWAIVWGHVMKKGSVNIGLIREGRMMCPSTLPLALSAVTHYCPLRWSLKSDGSCGPATWIELTPRTGRMHQLRVHMHHLGYPIVGDTLYSPQQTSQLPMALHCQNMAFVYQDQAYNITCAPPTNFGNPWTTWSTTPPF